MLKKENNEITIIKRLAPNLCFSAVNSDMIISLQRHDYFETVITIKNNYIHTVNGFSYIPEVGDAVILRPQDCHSARPIDDKKEHVCRDVYINISLFKETCNFISPTLFDSIMIMDEPPKFKLNESVLNNLNERLGDSLLYIGAKDYRQYKALTKTLTAEILGYYLYNNMPEKSQLPTCITKLLIKFHDDVYSKKTLSEIADEIGYSRDHLSRVFKEYFGKTLIQFINEKRVYDSLTYLLQSNMSVNEISAAVGWCDVGNYIFQFKKLYGTTPAKYRRDSAKKSYEQALVISNYTEQQ